MAYTMHGRLNVCRSVLKFFFFFSFLLLFLLITYTVYSTWLRINLCIPSSAPSSIYHFAINSLINIVHVASIVYGAPYVFTLSSFIFFLLSFAHASATNRASTQCTCFVFRLLLRKEKKLFFHASSDLKII